MFDIGPLELLVVIGAAIMLFGGDLPDVARKAGRMVRRLRTVAGEAARNLEAPDIARLTGAAEFRDELDVKADLDLEAEADIDWHDVARLPDEARGGTAPPTTPTGPKRLAEGAGSDAAAGSAPGASAGTDASPGAAPGAPPDAPRDGAPEAFQDAPRAPLPAARSTTGGTEPGRP